MTIIERFNAKTRLAANDCIEWTAGKQNKGYGNFGFEGRTQRAHRVAYRLFVGPIPEGLCVLHTCDNRACVNPDHLWIGTQGDNIRDCCEKGRIARGVKIGASKLNINMVLEIRQLALDGIPQAKIATRFSVTKGAVGQIVRKETWKHV